jgi:hypothetical protein
MQLVIGAIAAIGIAVVGTSAISNAPAFVNALEILERVPNNLEIGLGLLERGRPAVRAARGTAPAPSPWSTRTSGFLAGSL